MALSPCFSQAQVPAETLELQGLSFRCSECRERSDGRCEITLKGQALLLDCQAALSALLGQAVDDPSVSAPSAGELKRYLLQVRRPGPDASSALKILLRSSDGRRLFVADAQRFLALYPTELEQLFDDGPSLPAELAETLWDQQSSQGLRLAPELKADLAFRKPSITEEEILSQLSGSDLRADLADLTALIAKSGGGALGGAITEMKQAVERCIAGADDLEQHAYCQAVRDDAPRHRAQYLKQLRTSELVSALQRRDLPEDAVKFFAVANDLHIKSSALHAQTSRLLGLLIDSDRDELKLAASDERFLKNVEALLPADRELAAKAALLLCHASMAALNREDLNLALRLVNRSAGFYRGDMQYRSLLVEQLKQAIKKRGDSFALTPETREFQSLYFPKSRVVPILLYLTAGGLALGGALLLFRGRIAERQSAPADPLGKEERQELRQLLAFFELPGFATESELSQVYRQRAKEVHPDTGHGPVEHFTLLNEKYQRAKELLLKKMETR